MITTTARPATDEQRRTLATALRRELDDTYDAVAGMLDEYAVSPSGLLLVDAANLLEETTERISALHAFAHPSTPNPSRVIVPELRS